MLLARKKIHGESASSYIINYAGNSQAALESEPVFYDIPHEGLHRCGERPWSIIPGPDERGRQNILLRRPHSGLNSQNLKVNISRINFRFFRYVLLPDDRKISLLNGTLARNGVDVEMRRRNKINYLYRNTHVYVEAKTMSSPYFTIQRNIMSRGV